MTKWARMRKRKERKRAEEELRRSETERPAAKLAEPENISENIQRPQEIEKIEDAKTSSTNSILSQIPRYVYLLAFFVLLSGIFVPLISYQISFDTAIQGTATLFLGLAGAILLFKAATSDNRRGIFMVAGFVLLAISLLLITQVQGWWQKAFF